MSNLSEAIKDVDTNEKNNPIANNKMIRKNMNLRKNKTKRSCTKRFTMLNYGKQVNLLNNK